MQKRNTGKWSKKCMSLLFETIRIDSGIISNLDLHNARFNRSRKTLFEVDNEIDLGERIIVPANYRHGVCRCKVIYGEEIVSIHFSLYQASEIRSIKLVEDDEISYDYKFLDRQRLTDHLQESDSDEILIVKNGLITDASIANVAFYDGSRWITPSTPLLKGTRREQYLREKSIIEEEIRPKDIGKFERIMLINAMRGMHDDSGIPIENIKLP